MGRPLGAYASDELDRPDLNKCPDCGCFFAAECCPLCGKPCPPEMRAGNRKPVKHAKRRTGGSGRVTFVEWYHSWWFIILLLFIFPLAGLVLLITSPHRRGVKIGIAAGFAAAWLMVSFGFSWIYGFIFGAFRDPLVDDSLTKAEYVEACELMDAKAFYRDADTIEGDFVCLTLQVSRMLTAYDEYGDTVIYYLFRADDGSFSILLRDCALEEVQNLIPGDRVTFYGQSGGTQTVWDDRQDQSITAPCLYAAYYTVR